MVASLSIADLQMLQLLEGPLGGITNGPATILAPSAAVVPLTVKGFAAQTGDLQQWQNSAGTVLAKVRNDGLIATNYVGSITGQGPYIDLISGVALRVVNASNASNIVFTARGMASQSGDLQQWQDSAGVVLAKVRADGFIQALGISNTATPGGYLSATSGGIEVINATNAAYTPLKVKGMASQSGDLQQWQDSAGAVKARVTAVGNLAVNVFYTGASVTGSRPSAASVGAAAQWYDTTLSKPIWSDGTIWRDAIGIAA